MKKKIISVFSSLILSCLVLFSPRAIKGNAEGERVVPSGCKSVYCMDEDATTCIYAEKEHERLPIASMCKIMTLILSFDAIRQGKMDFETPVPVSERAMSMGGSQVYLQAGETYTAERLLESVTVCSANDSCVALAEYIAGSDDAFVEKMNERAKGLGCEDTLFSNCTGLPKEPQYSCAKDVALMLKELLKNEEYYRFARIWTDEFPHEEGRTTLITNTNKLIRRYQGCDGGKTGYTVDAGFCLAATAKRNDMRVISVCIGAPTSKDRFDAVTSLFDYAFARYESRLIVKDDEVLSDSAAVKNGKAALVPVRAESSLRAVVKKGENPEYTTQVYLDELNAPVRKGDRAGKICVYQNGVLTRDIAVVCDADVEKASYWDYVKNISSKMKAI